MLDETRYDMGRYNVVGLAFIVVIVVFRSKFNFVLILAVIVIVVVLRFNL